MIMNKQRGVTMVEMMISLLLGLSLLAAISELFVQSQKSNRMQRSVSYMMEDGRYVLEIMSKELRRAGYLRNPKDPNATADKLFIADSEYENVLGSAITFAKAEMIHGTTGNPMGDDFAVRYQLNDAQDLGSSEPNNSNSPCTQYVGLDDGEDPAIQNHIISLYFFVDDDNGTPVLYCRAKRNQISFEADTTRVNCIKPSDCNGSTPDKLPIISNVVKLIIKYGVNYYIDSVNGKDVDLKAADYYVSADNMTDVEWKKVVSAKVFVVMRSEEDNMVATNMTYNIDGTDYTAEDRRMYRVFSTTVTFRNSME